MDISTIGMLIYFVLFFALCWGVKKAICMIIDITDDLAASYESLGREVMKNKEDILKLRSEIIAAEYRKQKQRNKRHARNDIKYENEVEKD